MTPAGAPPRSIVLAVPEGGPFAPIVQSSLARAGWGTLLVHQPGALQEILGESGAALVVLDMALPGTQKALHALKLAPQSNWVPIVAIFPRGSAPLRPPALRVRADVELVEPIEIRHLVAGVERKAVRSSQPPSTRKVCIVLPSRLAELDRAVEVATAFLAPCGLEEEAQTSFLAAFREAVGNAVQHGNKGDPAKSVCVELRQNPATVTISVRDEGPGFDAQSRLHRASHTNAAQAARERHREGGAGGLGMYMLLRGSDLVRYSQRGNLVTLTIFLRRQRS